MLYSVKMVLLCKALHIIKCTKVERKIKHCCLIALRDKDHYRVVCVSGPDLNRPKIRISEVQHCNLPHKFSQVVEILYVIILMKLARVKSYK